MMEEDPKGVVMWQMSVKYLFVKDIYENVLISFLAWISELVGCFVLFLALLFHYFLCSFNCNIYIYITEKDSGENNP